LPSLERFSEMSVIVLTHGQIEGKNKYRITGAGHGDSRSEVKAMANEEHLALLQKGVEAWNAWRSDHAGIRANLFRANLEGVDLAGANLRHVDFRRANLQGTVLKTADLSEAYLIGANLHDSDLSGANLRGALLREANLSNADLSEADLSEAYLSDADLSRCKISHTKFERTRLTGVCVEDWHLDRATCLDRAICEYLYLKHKRQECRPRLGSFAAGELVQLFQQLTTTVELTFANGIEWSVLLKAIEVVRVRKNIDKLSILGLEESENGSLIVRFKISKKVDRIDAQQNLWFEYDRHLKALEEQYFDRPDINRRQIEIHRERNANLMEIVRVLATRSTEF